MILRPESSLNRVAWRVLMGYWLPWGKRKEEVQVSLLLGAHKPCIKV